MEEVTMDGQVQAATDKRDTVDFWRKWLKAAKQAAEQHWLISKAAWDEYEAKESSDRYPIYWSSCKTIEPAYYSRTPQLTNRRRFDIDDEDAAVACLINKRLADYLVENANFDAVMMSAVGDYFHADKTTTQVINEGEFEEVPLTFARDEVGNPAVNEKGEIIYYDPEGNVFQGVIDDSKEEIVGKRIIEETQKIYLAAVPYDEVLHTPEAKTQAEIKEMAFKFIKTRDEAVSFIGDEKVLSAILWKKSRIGSEDQDARRKDRIQTGEEYLEGWEIYSKPNKTKYWYSEQYKEGFLKTDTTDPEGFKDFFPSPAFILGSKPSKNLYPVPVYKRLKPMIETLTEQSEKIYELMDAIDPRALIDGTCKDLLDLTNEGSAQYIAITDFAKLTEKGGIGNLVQFLPVEPLVNALTTFLQAEDTFKNTFYEHLGLPDILRGVSDQVSTATEQTLSASAGHDRFKFQKKQVRQLARDSIEMMLDLAYKVFSDAKIARIVGFDYLKEDQKARFGSALAILRDDETRLVRIDIETDSMSFIDEQLRSQQVNQAVTTFTQGLRSVAQTTKEDPELAMAELQALLESLESLGAPGQSFLETAKKTLEKKIQDAQAAAEEAKNKPPQPSPEERKIAVEEGKLQLEHAKFQFEQQKAVTDQRMEAMQQNFQQQIDAALLNLQQVQEKFDEFERSELLKLEEYKVQLDEREKFIEEQRLAYQQQIEQIQLQAQAMQPQVPQQPQTPAVSINIDASKPETPIIPIGGL